MKYGVIQISFQVQSQNELISATFIAFIVKTQLYNRNVESLNYVWQGFSTFILSFTSWQISKVKITAKYFIFSLLQIAIVVGKSANFF